MIGARPVTFKGISETLLRGTEVAKASCGEGKRIKKMNIRRGFSLIELLIVMAILVLLSSVLLPVFGRARGKALQTSCASRLRQIGTAAALYRQDHDETLPLHDNCAPAGRNLHAQIALLPYLASAELWRCPADDAVDRTFRPAPENPCGAPPARWASYGFFAGGAPGFPPQNGVADASVTRPSDLVLFLESGEPDGRLEGNCDLPLPDADMASCRLSPVTTRFWTRHDHGFNAVFHDGRARWTRFRAAKSAFAPVP